MNCIKPDIRAKKYQRYTYRGFEVCPHPNAASQVVYGARRPEDRKLFAGPFRTAKEAEAAIDAEITAHAAPVAPKYAPTYYHDHGACVSPTCHCDREKLTQ